LAIAKAVPEPPFVSDMPETPFIYGILALSLTEC
jgi:hypothetical protein